MADDQATSAEVEGADPHGDPNAYVLPAEVYDADPNGVLVQTHNGNDTELSQHEYFAPEGTEEEGGGNNG